MTMHRPALLFAALFLVLQPAGGPARTILITNDDGLTSNVVALHRALVEGGHDVIVSVPCTNQSGMGAAIRVARPLGPLAQDCLNGAAGTGAPGAGPMTRPGLGEDFHYVDGTPVMAMLYGVDVLAAERWGAPPELVLSGPNEGQNVGAIILSSGTVSAAQAAALRGIPAIALSAGSSTADNEGLANPQSAEVARFSVALVAVLDTQAGSRPLLPPGVALNVNFPDALAGAHWRLTRIGSYNAYRLRFAENMAESAPPELVARARERGMEIPPLPGIVFGMNDAPTGPGQQDDESVVYREAIAVSPMQAGYESQPAIREWLGGHLHDLLAPEGEQDPAP
jgi:5'-nucleotidase